MMSKSVKKRLEKQMPNNQDVQQVREEIAEQLYVWKYGNTDIWGGEKIGWEGVTEDFKLMCRKEADSILAIEGVAVLIIGAQYV